jgi:hypothetical protein
MSKRPRYPGPNLANDHLSLAQPLGSLGRTGFVGSARIPKPPGILRQHIGLKKNPFERAVDHQAVGAKLAQDVRLPNDF